MITSGMLLITTVTAILFPKVLAILSIMSGTGGISLGVIIPTALYLSCHPAVLLKMLD